MTKLRSYLSIFFLLFLSSCGALQKPDTVPLNRISASPTPFQPSARIEQTWSQVRPTQVSGASAVVLPVQSTVTPLPTAIQQTTPQTAPDVLSEAQPVLDTAEVITFLLLGSDTRGTSSFRTDTLLIVILRPIDGQVSLISIPRDLWVNIPTVGMQRINTAYPSGEYGDYPGGGPGLLKDTILYNLGLQIDHFAMVDFDGFRKLVDTIGGIDVPVYCPYTDWRMLDPSYDPEDENSWFLYTAGPGLLHMDGDLALWYARSRKHSDDFDRGRRQQEVIRAIYSQSMRAQLLPRLPELYADLSSSFVTDLGLADILKLSPMALHMTGANIRSFYISGDMVSSWITPGGADVLLPNTEGIQQMLNEAMAPSERQQEREKVSIEVQNGSSTDGMDTLAAERLSYAGYNTSFHSADDRNHGTSLLYDLTAEQNRNKSAGVLAVLGLPDSALVSVPSNGSKVSYALIVGSDYDACFDPANLAP